MIEDLGGTPFSIERKLCFIIGHSEEGTAELGMVIDKPVYNFTAIHIAEFRRTWDLFP